MTTPGETTGRIVGISGPTVTVRLEGPRLYERVLVGDRRLQGEVVRLEQDEAVVQVYEETRGLARGEEATGLGGPLTVRLAPGLMGEIYDGLQRPLRRMLQDFGPFVLPGNILPPLRRDRTYGFVPARREGETVQAGELIGHVMEGALIHPFFAPRAGTIAEIRSGDICPETTLARLRDGGVIDSFIDWPVRTPRPVRRRLSPHEPLITGQRCIDLLFPLARGGTAILPGGFGTGKTILEQAIAKFAEVDIVIYVGCGERGNEMAEMLDEFSSLSDPWSGRPLSERTIMIANTSNMPVAAREASIYTAAAMGEYYRDMGCHVLLLADSISRWAEALREISSALEEMPGEEGYPTYLASRLAGFLARAGVAETLSGRIGSLSMILSVSPPGGDFSEPTTQACLRNAGTFLMLDSALAHRRHFPAINWFQSFSLYSGDVAEYCRQHHAPDWPALQTTCNALLQKEDKLREVAEIVGAEGLQDSDRLLMESAAAIREGFLQQNSFGDDAFSTPALTVERIRKILRRHGERLAALGARP